MQKPRYLTFSVILLGASWLIIAADLQIMGEPQRIELE